MRFSVIISLTAMALLLLANSELVMAQNNGDNNSGNGGNSGNSGNSGNNSSNNNNNSSNNNNNNKSSDSGNKSSSGGGNKSASNSAPQPSLIDSSPDSNRAPATSPAWGHVEVATAERQQTAVITMSASMLLVAGVAIWQF